MTDTPRREAKLARAIQILLRPARLEHLWTNDGPTPEALHVRRALGRPLSGEARVLVLSAFDVWDQKGMAYFGELVDQLPVDQLTRLLTLAIAIKTGEDQELDAWLTRYAE
jgi:hypothetical protein